MKYYVEEPLRNFKFWSGATRANNLSDEMLDRIENELECISDDWSDTAINDAFWHEPDWIAELVGYKDWEHLEEDISSDDVQNANDWAESLCDDQDFITMDDIADAGDIHLIYPVEDEWDIERNIDEFNEWWDSLSDIRKVKIYRDNS